ncbi:3-isopropylmalate dehydratase large subunit [Croceicoccus gelatinilyticus]|uniref:3-isopropylmalate dehydratase large subunit n=1 Tax=Croceicoccus gelatinilyticus TaxID=2835536 RepID=UPI001BCB5DAA|nr:3-isopropylmalate dehydratase large subunit [Croceicoccus gelatinilyticus]MBS7669061.1 3-isopropylmalate dehydratase large subunit [Croceicoccus gelatinilyticus]
MTFSFPSSPRTLFQKIWDGHVVDGGTDALVAIDRIWLHERTGGVALTSLAESGRTIAEPANVFVTLDHVVDTLPGRTDETIMPTGSEFIRVTRDAALAAGLTFFDLDDERQGIIHVISPEQGVVLPGVTLVCPDSHTCTQGAFGALAWGIGSTEAEHALATMTLNLVRPQTMRISVGGVLGGDVQAKDLALYVISQIGSAGARGHVIEFAGSAIEALSIEGRMTLCNMAAEMGAFSAIIAPDAKVFEYLNGRPYAPKGSDWDAALESWQDLSSDDGATFDAEFAFDAADVAPMVSWGTNPQQSAPFGLAPASGKAADGDARSLDYMDVSANQPVAGLPIGGAFIGSCTNARFEDLEIAARVLKGRKVADGVRAICVPGSGGVKRRAEDAGIDLVFREAGFEWREPGCSMCFFVGGESFGEGERVISSTNRNFENRQGAGTRTHIASPASVAASAVLGRIASVRELEELEAVR